MLASKIKLLYNILMSIENSEEFYPDEKSDQEEPLKTPSTTETSSSSSATDEPIEVDDDDLPEFIHLGLE
jgi:hypothetical protein